MTMHTGELTSKYIKAARLYEELGGRCPCCYLPGEQPGQISYRFREMLCVLDLPPSRGGEDTEENRLLLCKQCMSKKGRQTLDEFMAAGGRPAKPRDRVCEGCQQPTDYENERGDAHTQFQLCLACYDRFSTELANQTHARDISLADVRGWVRDYDQAERKLAASHKAGSAFINQLHQYDEERTGMLFDPLCQN